MKIQTKGYLGLQFLLKTGTPKGINLRADTLEMFRKRALTEQWTGDQLFTHRWSIGHLMDDSQYSHYLIAETAQKMAAKLKIGDDFDFSILNDLPFGHYCYLLSPGEFIRFFRDTDGIYVYQFADQQEAFNQDGKSYLRTWTQVEYYTVSSKMGLDHIADPKYKELAKRLVQLILFVSLADVEVLLVPAGKKAGGSRTSGTSIYNESPVPISRVDSNWNKYLVRGETIGVRDYLRFQRHGPGLTKTKLVLIKAHERKGHVRVGGGAKDKISL